MSDEMVLRAQVFVNEVYGQRIGMTVQQDGVTGWNTMYGLTRALQLELGITALSNSFGPATLAALNSQYPVLNAGTMPNANVCRIIQSALYCKGYDGGQISGVYDERTQVAVAQIKGDMGVAGGAGADLTPKVFKALLTMDAYVTVGSGSEAVRSVQRWLNGRYVTRRDYFVIPCDGRHSRDVAKSMLLAVQYELGMADGVANGVFGPGTQSGLRSRTVSQGSSGIWVSLFSAAMLLNHRPVAFTSTFDGALADDVRGFQAFAELPVTGAGDFQTWASLLISYGDQDRMGEACDGVTKITAARAATLRAQGITYVGRYLTNLSTTSLPEKTIQPGELATIAENGLRCFPIYQTNGREASNFTYALGRAAGYAAMNAAADHGFKNGTRIFFAVDFDALDDDITRNVLPHFKGIQDSMDDAGNPYEVGVYGPRNVCTRVAGAGHSTASFVSDMSSGFSGNYGFPLPADWAYDQIVTRTVGTGAGRIEIDVNIASGRDVGQNQFNPPRAVVPDTLLAPSLRSALETDVGRYMETMGFASDGGVRNYTHAHCLKVAVLDHDDVVTELSQRFSMRKALIQTSAYWEMRHLDALDELQDSRVIAYHSGLPGGARDSSTGIAQINGEVAIRSWNHCIQQGYTTGTVLDPDDDAQLYARWQQVKNDVRFALQTVAMIHLWGADGKPGGNNPDGGETDLPAMSLTYTEPQTFEVLRRYQGYGAQAVTDAQTRMPLFHIFEKYNSISRHA